MLRTPSLPRLCLAMAIALAAVTSAQAAPDAARAQAMAQFQRAAEGDSGAVEGAAAAWRQLSAAQPADPVLRAYAGASTAMLATTTLLPWRKLSHAEDGLALLDKALAQLTPADEAAVPGTVPAALEVRFTAASTFLALPSFFNRGVRGAKLLDEVARNARLDSTPLSFRAAVWLRAGLEAAKAQRSDEARQWLRRAADSGAPQAAVAQARLKEI